MPYAATLNAAAPDILLASYAVLGLVFGAIAGRNSPALLNTAVLALALASGLAFVQIGHLPATGFGGGYKVHAYIALAKSIAFGLAAASLWVSRNGLTQKPMNRFEFPILIIFACLGIGVMLSANDLLVLYMGMETLALSSYVLASFQSDNARVAEAGLKYFILGAIASCIFLFGSSMVYGFAGGMSFDTIAQAEASSGLVLGLIFVLAGLVFKIAAAPFHVWTPDVYQGAPLPSVTFFATASKFAAFMLLTRLLFEIFAPISALWPPMIAGLSAASMIIGALGALRQTDLKRLLAYSSIANIGFALICLAAASKDGAGAALVYMTLYALAALGLFGGIQIIRGPKAKGCDIDLLNGLARNRPGLAVLLGILVFSMAGIPPMAGFFGKWAAFEIGLEAGLIWLVLLGVLMSVVSLGYYLRLIWAMFMVEPSTSTEPNLVVSKRGFLIVSLAAFSLFPILVVWIGNLNTLAQTVSLHAF